MRFIVDVGTADLSQELAQSGCNAQDTTSRRKTLSCSCNGAVKQAQGRIGRQAGADDIVLSQADGPSWSHNPQAFSEELGPFFWGKKGDEPSIDEIKGVVVKIKRPRDIHDLERGVVQFLYLCKSACVIDCTLTDIDTSHFDLRILVGQITDPLTRTAAEIEDGLHGSYIRSLCERPSHGLGEMTILVDETGCFCCTLGIDEVFVLVMWGVGCHGRLFLSDREEFSFFSRFMEVSPLV